MPAPRFTGREHELGELARVLATPGATVLVEGETGIGKSRLISEFLATAAGQGLTPLVARCPALREPQTLGPLTDAARQAAGEAPRAGLSGLAGALRPLFPEWAPVLPPAPGPVEDASAVRHRLFRALAELIGSLGVTLLVVEDAHWADDATLEFLLFLAAHPADPLPCGLLVTYRPEDVPPGSLLSRLSRLAAGPAGLRLCLAPLDVAATARLVSSMLDREHVSAEFAAFLHQRTEGVPLAVEELVRLMGARDDVARRDGHWVRRHLDDIAVPPTVRDAVSERAGRLSTDAQLMLRAAAVLAAPAAEATLTAVSGLPAARATAALCEALDCGLLAEDGRALVSFRHALAALAVYDAIPGPDRRAMHLRAGRLLAAGPAGAGAGRGKGPAARGREAPSAQLARHFREGGDTGLWCLHAERAADLALASGDENSAQNLLHDLVLNAGLPAGVVAGLVRKIPFTSFIAAERQVSLVRTLRELLDVPALGPEEEADLRVQLGELLTATQDWGPARTELERSVPGLAHDPAEAARAMMLLAWPRGSSCPAAEHRRWLRRADRLSPSLDPAHRLRLLVDRATALLMLGQEAGWAEAAKVPEDSAQAPLRQQVARAHLNFGDQATRWGRYGEADRRLVKAYELTEQHHYLRMREAAQIGLLRLHWFMGRWDGLGEQAARLAADEEIHPQIRAEAALVAGLMHAAAGVPDPAEEYFGLAGRDLRKRGDDSVVEAAAALARLWLAAGRPGDAAGLLAEHVALVAAKGIWVWATDLAPVAVRALAATGRLAEADELVRSFARGLRGRHAPAPLAALAGCRATLAQARADQPRAAALFARAAAAWQKLPNPYESMLARERQAGCLLAGGEPEAGLALLTEVFSDLSALAARGDAERVRRTLRQHGVDARGPARGGRPGYGDRLSPREIQVVRLLLDGRTNRQIAEALVVSTQTVASHLHSAMRKLQVSSRTALAVRCAELGIVSRAPRASHLLTAQNQ
jgi:DNA-binding CsgD family transcriptional regulator